MRRRFFEALLRDQLRSPAWIPQNCRAKYTGKKDKVVIERNIIKFLVLIVVYISQISESISVVLFDMWRLREKTGVFQ